MEGVLLHLSSLSYLSARVRQHIEHPIAGHLEATAPSYPFLPLVTVKVCQAGKQARGIIQGESASRLLDNANHLNRDPL